MHSTILMLACVGMFGGFFWLLVCLLVLKKMKLKMHEIWVVYGVCISTYSICSWAFLLPSLKQFYNCISQFCLGMNDLPINISTENSKFRLQTICTYVCCILLNILEYRNLGHIDFAQQPVSFPFLCGCVGVCEVCLENVLGKRLGLATFKITQSL